MLEGVEGRRVVYLILPQWHPPSYSSDLGLEPPGVVGLSADMVEWMRSDCVCRVEDFEKDIVICIYTFTGLVGNESVFLNAPSFRGIFGHLQDVGVRCL